MIWLYAIVLFICALCCWLLLAAVTIDIDSRAAAASIRWVSIGSVTIYYDDEWWIAIKVLFYHKKMRLRGISKKHPPKQPSTAPKKAKAPQLKTILQVLKSFTVQEWQLAVDTGDVTWNALLYPLNFMPGCYTHININFVGENYCCIKIINRPWKILLAYLR